MTNHPLPSVKLGFSGFGTQNFTSLNISGGVNLLVNVVVILNYNNVLQYYFIFISNLDLTFAIFL